MLRSFSFSANEAPGREIYVGKRERKVEIELCAQDWNELMKKKKTNYKRLLSDSYSLD